MTPEDLAALRLAVRLLECPGLAARLMDLAGSPIEALVKRLPARANEVVRQASQRAIQKSLEVAINSLDKESRGASADQLHKAAVTTSGALGGFLGIGALLVELPVSTTLMLRSIADIARSEGEDLHDAATGLACIEVFALGGRGSADDAAETGYFAVRAALAQTLRQAAAFLAQRGAMGKSAPLILRLVGQIAARFGIVVSQKAAAQAVPVLGAVGGASINYAFMEHFQNIARAHFTIRRLERRYLPEAVRALYEEERARLQC